MDLGTTGRRTRRTRTTAWAAAAILLAGAGLTACGDDSGGGGDAPPPEPSVEETADGGANGGDTPDAEAPDEDAPDTDATAPADPAAAEKEVKENWEKFFDPKTAMKDKEELLENGAKMRKVLQSFNGDERGQQVQAKADEVEFTSATDADVTYTLSLEGATVMPDASGTAVLQDDTWKVSVKTLCALVQLSGNESPGPGC
ncbi:hypothetical protein DY218_08820 [Streptomyces triticagri]|uniref:Low molecular weight antigen MTB12-like C-terminal domain-containing protein n=1 Tax=Streptomyces triticagri TaxID=2293568 RepID=A0A372M8B4_9ACTN|nr:hypothetical protein [Streptomyces triticagri]RFU87079.1 hypothetical protein DY218_08820 [Streptomyces triticagri]